MPDTLDFDPAAILFDCDGTLLLTSDLHFAAISEAAARQGAEMPQDWYMGLTGLERRGLFARFAGDFGLQLDVPTLVADSIALTITRAAAARENPEVASLARRLSLVKPVAVVTNSEAAVARAVLGATGLLPLFQAIITAEDAERPKPAPDLYLVAADRLGVKPNRCLVLEDSDQGLQAAREAGAVCLDVRLPDWKTHAEAVLGTLA
jgi:HAD superfamily hydrolase (TIGR01509 family)